MRDAVVELAQLGSPKENPLLSKDILFLLITDQPPENPGHFHLSLDYEMTNVTCGLKKTIKHIAHKIAKFIKKHKKEILIGTATAVGIAVAAKTISSNHERRRHYLPPPPPSPTPLLHLAPEPLPPDEMDEENEEECEDLIFSSDEIEVSNPINQHDPTIIELAKYLGAEAAHEAWDSIAFATPAIVVIPTRIALGDTLANKEDTWTNQIVPKVHGVIDEFFEQNISFGDKQRAAERFDTGTPPLPFFVLGRIAKQLQKIISPSVGKVAVSEALLLEKSALNNISIPTTETSKEIEKLALVAERRFANAASEASLLEKSVLDNTRIQSNGIWELGGENIKRMNLKKMLAKNRFDHIFNNPEHHLEQLKLTPQITYEKLTEALVNADRAGQIPINQPFEVLVRIDDCEIVVRGIIIEGELKYSTFFIPEKR